MVTDGCGNKTKGMHVYRITPGLHTRVSEGSWIEAPPQARMKCAKRHCEAARALLRPRLMHFSLSADGLRHRIKMKKCRLMLLCVAKTYELCSSVTVFKTQLKAFAFHFSQCKKRLRG